MQTINFGFSFYAVSAAEDACAQFTVRSGTMEPFPYATDFTGFLFCLEKLCCGVKNFTSIRT